MYMGETSNTSHAGGNVSVSNAPAASASMSANAPVSAFAAPTVAAAPAPKTDWLTTLIQGASGILQLSNQQKLAKTNMQRAAQGLPPIQLDQVPGIVPTAAVNVGVDTGTSKLITWAAIGGGLLLTLNMLRKKRR